MKKILILLLILASVLFADTPTISTNNSTTSTLTAGNTYTGTFEDVSNFQIVRVFLKSNVASATGGLILQWSTDGSAISYEEAPLTVFAQAGKILKSTVISKYFRVKYVNGSTNQGSFEIQTSYEGGAAGLPSTRLLVNCRVTTSATTSTVIGNCLNPGAGRSIYVTDISVYGGVATGATASAAIQYGTGGTCGTGTTVIYDCQHGAVSGCQANFTTPIKAGSNSELCLLDPTVGTKFVSISGYVDP